MRPARRFGGVRRAAARLLGVFLLMAASAGSGLGQDWVAEKVDPNGHSTEVVAVALGRDGKALVTASREGPAKLWEVVETGRITFRADLTGHGRAALSVAISPDGQTIATGGSDRAIRLWDSAGRALATLSGHSGDVDALAFSPGGDLLASGGADTSIRIWDVAGHRALKTLQGHSQGVRGLAFSPDGKALASAGRDRDVKLWDVAEGSEKMTLGRHDTATWCVAFSPDGRFVASGGLDKTVRLWRVGPAAPQAGQAGQGGQPQPAPEVIAFFRPGVPSDSQGGQPNQAQAWQVEGEVAAVAFSADGQYVAAAEFDLSPRRPTPGSVEFLGIPGGVPGQDPNQTIPPRPRIRGHLGSIRAVAFGPGGKFLVTGGGDASIRLWDASTAKGLAVVIGPRAPVSPPERIMTHLDPVDALAISPDESKVVTATESAGLTLWDASTREVLGRLREPRGPIRALAISPDGKLLATGGDDKVVTLRDFATGGELDRLRGHDGPITSLAFSPDGRTLASGSKDGSATLWDVARRAEAATLARHTSAVTCLAFSQDGKSLATGGLDYTVKLWDLPEGAFRASLEGHRDVVEAVAFAPDGKSLASADRTGLVRVWDVARGDERASIQAPGGQVHALAFSPDGRTLVTGGDDRAIRAWSPVDGRSLASTLAHQGPIRALAIGAGGKLVASGGGDRELRLWNYAEVGPRSFGDLDAKVVSIAVTPDGRTVATASADGAVKTWDAAGLVRHALIRYGTPGLRLSFSADGQTLAALPVGSKTEPITLWDVATGRPREGTRPEALRANALALALTPDGQGMVTASRFGVKLISPAADRPDRPFEGATSSPQALAVGPDGRTVAVGSADGKVTTWDPAAPEKPRLTFRPSSRGISTMAFSPDGATLAIGGLDRSVHLVEAATGRDLATLRGPRKAITSLAFSPDGKLVASASDGEPTLFVWETAEGKPVSTPTLIGPSNREGFACLAFSGDGLSLLAGGERGVSTFDMRPDRRPPATASASGSPPRPGQERATLRGHAETVRSLTFLGDGRRLASRSEDGVVKVWDLGENREALSVGGPEVKVRGMAISPDGKLLAVGLRPPPPPKAEPRPGEAAPVAPAEPAPAPAPGSPQEPAPAQVRVEPKPFDEVKIWSLDEGHERGTIAGKATNGQRDLVVSLAYSPDGKALATASRGGSVHLWDASTLAPGVELAKTAAKVDLVLFADDGRRLVGANASGQVTVWNVEKGEVATTLAHPGGMNMVVVAPDGKTLATAGGRPEKDEAPSPDGEGGDVRIWDVATGRRLAVLATPGGRVNRLAFAPDGRTLAASSEAPAVTLWDLAESAPRATLSWPEGSALFLAFSPDGKALAAVGEDRTLRVWDVPAGTLRAALSGHDDAIDRVAFSPDGKTLATAGLDALIKLWDVPPAGPGAPRP